MQTEEIFVAVKDIQEGDEFRDSDGNLHWKATAPAERGPNGEIRVAVEYGDGGRSVREWSAADADWQLSINRPVAA